MQEINSQQQPLGEDQDHTIHLRDPHAAEKIKRTERGVMGFFVRRERITLIFMIAVVLMGVYALFNIPREADPEVKIPIAVVTTVFPGASPLDVERLVTDVLETKIEQLDNLDSVSSQSMLGLSSITVEFEASADLERSIDDLKSKVDEAVDLPEDATDPQVIEVRISDTPIITYSLGSTLDAKTLTEIGERVEDELEKIKGVSEVTLLGADEQEFLIAVNPAELERLHLSLSQIVGIIASANTDTPLGNVSVDEKNYNVRAVAKIDSLEELKEVVVTVTADGSVISLADIANVDEKSKERSSLSRLSIEGQKSENTVSLQIQKKTGGNILDIVDTSKEVLENLKEGGTIPPQVEVIESSDYSQFIRKDLQTLGSSGIQSMVLIFIILLISLSLREAIISLVAIPTTFLITFYVLYMGGYTLNSLVLFTLVLSLGLLVDAFIIVLEGIFHNLREGYSSKEAALLTIAHYRDPLISGTLTTVAAFVPMLLVSGILGEFLEVLPVTISVTLLSSLFVSLTIVPAVAVLFLGTKKRKAKLQSSEKKESILERTIIKYLLPKYKSLLIRLLNRRSAKYIFVSAIAALFFGSIALLATGIIPVKLFPEVDIEFSFIDIEMPVGTTLEKTDELVRQVESRLYNVPEIKSFVTTVGRSSGGFGLGPSGQSNEHLASINITYVDAKERNKKSYELNEELRKLLGDISIGKVTVQEVTAGPPTGSPIEARIMGPDLQTLQNVTDRVVSILEGTEGTINIVSDREVSPADVTFTLNRQALAQSQLTVGDVSSFLRTAVFGVTATEITREGDDIDVRVQLEEGSSDSIQDLQNLGIINRSGQAVRLSHVADFSFEPALASINHLDFERTTRVRADLDTGFNAAQITQQLEQSVEAADLPTGYTVTFGGEVEDIEQSFSELWNAMIVAVILIAFILVLQFDSFRKPFIILLTLPMVIIGTAVGMIIFSLPFSFSVFLGVISLAGIGVNDAIVLIDKINRNVTEQKMNPKEAAINAGQLRLQPIILTTVTTIAGVIPLAFADEFWLGLSISIIFGLLFSTLLQLFIIPAVYLQFEGKRDLRRLREDQQSTQQSHLL